MTHTHDFAVTIPALPYVDIEGRVEVNITNWGRPARTYGDPDVCYPAEGVEFELGSIEVISGRHYEGERLVWEYRPLDEAEPLGKLLADAIREALDPDDIADKALEERFADIADAEERRAEQRREEAWL